MCLCNPCVRAFFFDTFGCFFFLFLSLFFVYEYIFYLNPMNSVTGTPAASSLNLPITFLFVLSEYMESAR